MRAVEAPFDAPMHPLGCRIGPTAIRGISIFSTFWGGVLFALRSPSYIPLRVKDRYYGTLAHKIFLHTLKATMHVYAHVWGPKTTCHDALEQVCVGGRAAVGLGGRTAVLRADEVSGKKKKKKKKCLTVTPRDTLFVPCHVAFYVVTVICGPLPSIILYGISVYFMNIP